MGSTQRRMCSGWLRASMVALATAYGCTTTPNEPDARVAVNIEMEAIAGPLVSLGETAPLVVVVRDQFGDRLGNEFILRESRDTTVAAVTVDGEVVARGNGQTTIVATVGQLSDSIVVTVEQRVARIRITPSSGVLELPGDTIRFSGEPVDARNNPMVDPVPVTWTGSGPVMASADGLITATGFGDAVVTASAGGASTPAMVEVIGDRFFLSGGVRLRYDLDLPAGAGPFPAIVFVHGSGEVTRNGQRDVTDPFIPYGVAVLRYDKRGAGESGGFYENPSVGSASSLFNLLATDAANAARFLTRIEPIDPSRIGLIGNSQGGWIVPRAALDATPDAVRYIMLWSGPTVSIGLEIFYSSLAEGTSTPLDEVYAQLPGFGGPDGYDPLSDIASLEVPGMWQFGAMDRSIPMRLDIDRLAMLAAQGKPFETVVWEFGDHALRDVRTRQFYDVWSEYVRFMRDHGILPMP